MTRTITLTTIVLLGLSAGAYGQTGPSSAGCGPETWSTDKMAYVGVPCSDGQKAAVPQQATAQLTNAEYCGALVTRYDTFLNKIGKRGGMLSTDVAANVAAAKCRAGDPSGIADLEWALRDAKVDLPPRS